MWWVWVFAVYSSLSLNPFFRYEPASVELANLLFQSGDYRQALVEYKRFLHYKPEDPRRPYLMFRMGVCYSKLGKYDKAERMLRKALEAGDEDLRERAGIALIRTLFLMDRYDSAKLMARLLMERYGSRPVAAEAAYLRGWCFLNEGNWFEAALAFRRAAEMGKGTELGLEATRLAEGCLEAIRLPRRSPSKARALSALIPGMGQLIGGDIKGAIWLAGELILGYLLVDSVESGRYFDAVLLGAGLGWAHLMNIRQAGRSAARYNAELETRLLNDLRKAHTLP